MAQTPRHNVFITYYHDQDQHYKDEFVEMLGTRIVDKSVNIGDIEGNSPPTEATLQRIRERYIATASVTVVLIGQCTWQRKYVDWEIGAGLRDTATNPRCGLLGLLLPGHSDYGTARFHHSLIPPRLSDNCGSNSTFAAVHDWPGPQGADEIKRWIHQAFLRRRRQPDPDISRHPFGRNWRGRCAEGWQ